MPSRCRREDLPRRRHRPRSRKRDLAHEPDHIGARGDVAVGLEPGHCLRIRNRVDVNAWTEPEGVATASDRAMASVNGSVAPAGPPAKMTSTRVAAACLAASRATTGGPERVSMTIERVIYIFKLF